MKFLRQISTGIFAVIIGFGFYLLAVALTPIFPKPRQPLTPRKRIDGQDADDATAQRSTVTFPVDGAVVHAWLYLPEPTDTPAPCIIMGHGLGGTKAMGLDRYAARFQAAGYAVLVFDYRGWGESGGEPRGLIWMPHQLEDYAAAIRYARSREDIDPTRIALWGTSLSGGHVVATAAGDHEIACIIAQCPGLDGREAMEMLYRHSGLDLRIIPHAQRDLVRSWLGLSAHKIPVVGMPGSIALLTVPDALPTFERLAPPDYVNEACARIAIRGDKYRPIKQADQVRCPTLLQICEHDDLVPNGTVEKAAAKIGDWAEIRRYPCGHFDIYSGDHFEASVGDQLEFLDKHLGNGLPRKESHS